MCQEQEALIRKVFDLVDGGMLFTVYHHTFGERLFEEPFTQPEAVEFTLQPAFFRPLRGHSRC